MDDTLAKDLVAMWQSELTAMAADREVREVMGGDGGVVGAVGECCLGVGVAW